MKKYTKQDHRALATWAAECAARVLPYFEKARPKDDRPRKAIQACRAWMRTGEFSMAAIRGASLAAHAAARQVNGNSAARFAARAAGQAVATAHVPQHAYGGAYYALKAIAAADAADAEARVNQERDWQARRLPERLKEQIMDRILVSKRGGSVLIKIRKGEGY
ncbi:MAG: putative immunity protein [Anaerolineales bacterium]